jgi:hypothetical protein
VKRTREVSEPNSDVFDASNKRPQTCTAADTAPTPRTRFRSARVSKREPGARAHLAAPHPPVVSHNSVPDIPETVRPALLLFVTVNDNDEQLGDSRPPNIDADEEHYYQVRRNILVEDNITANVYGDDNGGPVMVAAEGMYTIMIDNRGKVRVMCPESGQQFDDNFQAWSCGANDNGALRRNTVV